MCLKISLFLSYTTVSFDSNGSLQSNSFFLNFYLLRFSCVCYWIICTVYRCGVSPSNRIGTVFIIYMRLNFCWKTLQCSLILSSNVWHLGIVLFIWLQSSRIECDGLRSAPCFSYARLDLTYWLDWITSPLFTCESRYCCIARFSHRYSVRPSICSSHGWISQKQCKLGSPNLYHRLPEKLLFQDP